MAGDVNRREFLRLTAGTGAAWMIGASGVGRAGLSPTAEILGEADDRIAKHRKGKTTLRVLGPGGQPLPAGTKLHIRQTRHAFLFGCNIFKLGRCRTPEDNAAYADRFAELLNFATMPFYWWRYELQRTNSWTYPADSSDERSEKVIRWCKSQGITTKGHPLAWNWYDPPWLTGTFEEVMRLQIERIARCVKRFKGNIDIWDVVNEATHYDREEAKRNAPKLTEAIAKTGIGEYVRRSFRAAREANPDATLIINDYRTDPTFEEKVISRLVDEDRKPLYDVIGIQSHMHSGYWGPARTWEVCERFAQYGKPLHFTETTLVSGPKSASGWTTTGEGEEQQAERAAEFYTVLFSHPAVEAVTWWDFSDQGAWQGAPAGLIRDDMSPKPVYERLADRIKRRWWTQETAENGADGRAPIEGFLGDYEVAAEQGGRRLSGRFSLVKDATEPTEVRMVPA
jgi:GH35 family endo-1,4-beta-xylanase